MRCASWYHTGCGERATVLLVQDDGKPNPGGYFCRRHGQEIVEEFAEKLRESWSLSEVDENGSLVKEVA